MAPSRQRAPRSNPRSPQKWTEQAGWALAGKPLAINVEYPAGFPARDDGSVGGLRLAALRPHLDRVLEFIDACREDGARLVEDLDGNLDTGDRVVGCLLFGYVLFLSFLQNDYRVGPRARSIARRWRSEMISWLLCARTACCSTCRRSRIASKAPRCAGDT